MRTDPTKTQTKATAPHSKPTQTQPRSEPQNNHMPINAQATVPSSTQPPTRKKHQMSIVSYIIG